MGSIENIWIKYVLNNYTYNYKENTIWIIPDALGFAEVSRFSIRFMWDKKIITESTNAELRRYTFGGEYILDGFRAKKKELRDGSCCFEVGE